jgi:hypothetical protein
VRPTELMGFAASVLDRLGIDYAIVGSMASSFYGDARLTSDVDIVANLEQQNVPAFVRAFPTEHFYISEDAIREAIRNQGQFNIIRPDSGLKIDVMIPTASEFDRQQFARRRREKARDGDFEAYFASPEDVILKKMEFYREGGSDKHPRDIAGMLKVSKDIIDHTYITDCAARLGLTEIWNKIQADVKPTG